MADETWSSVLALDPVELHEILNQMRARLARVDAVSRELSARAEPLVLVRHADGRRTISRTARVGRQLCRVREELREDVEALTRHLDQTPAAANRRPR
jgi:hypothetical protein